MTRDDDGRVEAAGSASPSAPWPKLGGAKVPRSEEPEAVGAILENLIGRSRLTDGLALGRLFSAWERVVGARLAGECRPVKLEAGTLVVAASSAAWAAQIGFLAKEIGRRANEVLGTETVRAVRAVVGRASGPAPGSDGRR